jgi:hypothetical protein
VKRSFILFWGGGDGGGTVMPTRAGRWRHGILPLVPKRDSTTFEISWVIITPSLSSCAQRMAVISVGKPPFALFQVDVSKTGYLQGPREGCR